MQGIKKNIIRLPKAVLLILLGLFIFGSNIATVNAQSADYEPSISGADSTYGNYLNLFSPINQGTPIFLRTGPVLNANNTQVEGVLFLFRSKFDTSGLQKSKRWFWDHVGYPLIRVPGLNIIDKEDDAFVIRTCPIVNDQLGNASLKKEDCLLSSIPNEIFPSSTDQGVFNNAIHVFGSSRDFLDKNWTNSVDTFSVRIPIRRFHSLSTITSNSLFSIADSPVVSLTANTKYQSDMWYCAENKPGYSGEFEIGDIGFSPIVEKKQVRYFGKICGGKDTYYVRIGQPVVFTYTTGTSDANNIPIDETADPNVTSSKDPTESILPQCSWFGLSDGSFNGCIAKGVYFLIYRPVAWLAGLAGNLFDFFLGYSLDDGSYRLDFAVTGWKLVRDISNIFFIIILVWTGFAAVFNIGSISMKKVVPTLIINALIINFSMFATRVVIDISNVFARVLYNTMNVTKVVDGVPMSANTDGPGGYKPISEKIVSAFNPQKMFSVQYISPEQALRGGVHIQLDDNQINDNDKGDITKRYSRNYANLFIVVSVIAAVILFSIAKMFWKTAFLFIGRVVGLYIAMIFSPFAFLTRGGVPLIGGIQNIKWSDWLRDLTNYAALAPIFMLFLYVVYAFANSDFVRKFNAFENGDASFLGIVLTISIPLLIVYFLISYGVDLAKKYSGTVGNLIQDRVGGVANTVTGIAAGGAIGLASGGLGLAGRGLGSVAQRVQNKTSLGNWINRNQGKATMAGWVARRGNAILEGTQKASFDPRNSKLISGQLQKLSGEFGVKLQTNNALLNAVDLSSKKTEGGLRGYQKRKIEEIKKQIEKVETHFRDDDEAKDFYKGLLAKEYAKQSGKSVDIDRLSNDRAFKGEAKKDLDEKIKSGVISSYDSKDIDRIAKEKRTAWESANKGVVDEYNEFTKKDQKDHGKVKDNKTLTQAMRLRYAQELSNDPTSLWNTIRAIAGAGIPGITGDLDRNTDETKRAADKYLKDTRKSFKNAEKAAKELETIDKTLTDILKLMAGKDPSKYSGFKNTKGEFDSKEMSGDEHYDMIKEHRRNLEDELSSHEENLDRLKQRRKSPRNAEIDSAQKDYDDAIESGNIDSAKRHEERLTRLKQEEIEKTNAEYLELTKKRNKAKEDIEDTKNLLKRKSDAERKAESKKDGDKKGEDKSEKGDDKKDSK